MASDIESKYVHTLNNLKEKIRVARQRASIYVNSELLNVYCEIGKTIADQEISEGWGAKIVESLSKDLKIEFPDMKGLSPRNLSYMRDFAKAYPHFPFLQAPLAKMENVQIDNNETSILQATLAKLQINDNQTNVISQAPLAQLTWYHHITILDKVKDVETRIFYIQKTIENGWSRDIMVHQIESGLHNRQGALSHNFKRTIPDYQSELTQQIFKDPYKFDFLTLGPKARERDLENALIAHVKNVIKELGDGFAFMAQQYNLQAGNKDYFIDLLFYHTKLHRHIAIELKIGDFEPEYVGKMNLYLGLLDDKLKGERDDPSIGLILCKTNDKIVAEYALRNTSKPIGIAEYKLQQLLPENFKGELPSIEEIEKKLDEEIKEHASPAEKKLDTLKQKLAGIKTEEFKTPATNEIMVDLFKNGLKPLYEELIAELEPINELFAYKRLDWSTFNHSVLTDNINEIEEKWMDENFLRSNDRLVLRYNLFAFKKAGVDNFNSYFELAVYFDAYIYRFVLNNSSGEPLLKKLYHQPIAKEDRNSIIETIKTYLLNEIEKSVDHLLNEIHDSL